MWLEDRYLKITMINIVKENRGKMENFSRELEYIKRIKCIIENDTWN